MRTDLGYDRFLYDAEGQTPEVQRFDLSTDADGNVTISRRVPLSLSSQRLWLQAFEPSTCALSLPVPFDLQ